MLICFLVALVIGIPLGLMVSALIYLYLFTDKLVDHSEARKQDGII